MMFFSLIIKTFIMKQDSQTVVVVSNKKSVGLAFLLAFLFGSLGLLYASVAGALILFVLGILLFFVLAFIGPMIVWIASMIWAVIAASNSR
jgi:hypothetical protein